MLDEGSFVHWKARMRHIIRGIDEDAWTAVEIGWSAPTMLMENKTYAPKPKERWTESEKAASKFNSKALTMIFSAVERDQFKIIQGCESAKEAWNVLVNHFEGDTSVRRTRIDHLASRFENLRMEDDKSIAGFVSKLSSIANETTVLGKKYKEKRETNLQCQECEGFDNLRNKCLLAKRKELKCIGCKGFGHTKSDCPNNLKKDKSLLCFSDTESESESDEEDLLNNFVALAGQDTMVDYHSSTDSNSNSDSEREGEDVTADLKSEYTTLFKKFAELSHENLQLIKDTAILKEQVNILELEKPATKAEPTSKIAENDGTDELQSLTIVIAEQNQVQQQSEIKFHRRKQLLNQELEKSQLLERQLTENYKKVRMLNTGSASLDHILSMGQSPKINWGLGYKGSTSQDYDKAEGMRFIKAGVKSDDTPKAAGQKVDKPKAEEKSGSVTESKENQNTACRNRGLLRGKQGHHGTSSQAVEKNEVTKVVKRSIPVVSAELNDESQANTMTPKIQDRKVVAKRRNGCHFCGKIGHSVAYCYARRNQVKRAWRLNLCFIEPKKYGCVWIAKRDLYPKFRRQTRHGLHLETDVSHKPVAEPVEEAICNFACIEVNEPEIINQASQKLNLKHGLSHLDREKHTADCVCNLCQSHLEKEERMKRKKGTSVRGDQGVTVYGGCNKKKTDTKLIGHVNQMRSIIPKASVAKTEKLSRKDVTHRDESVTHESINWSLIYLTTRRSDLGLTTGIYTPWLAISRVSHQLVVKEISNHVKGILKLKLHYSFDTNMMMAETCDVNWMCYWDENNLKMCHKASRCLAEMEYTALKKLWTLILVKRSTHVEYGSLFDPFDDHCNNLNDICIIENPVQLSLTKQVEIRHHPVRELIEEKLVVIEHVASENKLVDTVTKLPEFNGFLCKRKVFGISDL